MTKWSKPVNCGEMLNNASDNEDIALTSNGEVAFISSQNEAGDYDLYKISLEETGGFEKVKDKADKPKKEFTARSIEEAIAVVEEEEKDLYAKEKQQLKAFEKQIQALKKERKTSVNDLVAKSFMPDFEAEADEYQDLRLAYADLQKEKALIENTEKSEDRELNQLKNRFNKAHNSEFTPKGGAVKKTVQEDEELSEMKKRFNQYNKTNNQNTDTSEEEYMDMELGGNETVFDDSYDLEYYKDDFLTLQQKLWKELLVKLEPKVIADIKKSSYAQVERKLMNELDEALDADQKTRLHHQSILYYRDIKKELRKAENQPLKLSIPASTVTMKLKQQFEPQIRKQLYEKLREATMNDVRNELYYRFLQSEKELLQRVIK